MFAITSKHLASKAAKLPFVRWIGFVQPVYKVTDALRRALGTARPGAPVVLTVTAHTDERRPDAVEKWIRKNGGKILRNSGGALLRCTLPIRLLPALAKLPAVLCVERFVMPTLNKKNKK